MQRCQLGCIVVIIAALLQVGIGSHCK